MQKHHVHYDHSSKFVQAKSRRTVEIVKVYFMCGLSPGWRMSISPRPGRPRPAVLVWHSYINDVWQHFTAAPLRTQPPLPPRSFNCVHTTQIVTVSCHFSHWRTSVRCTTATWCDHPSPTQEPTGCGGFRRVLCGQRL